MDLWLSVLAVCTLSFYHKSLSLSCNWMKEGERLLVSSKNMSKKTTMTDLCAYLTTFFCSISQGLNREKRRVPFADTIGTAVQTALPFWAQRIESYNIMVSPYALCFIQHFQSSTSFLTESSFISTRCLFSPPLFTENCGHWGFWLNKALRIGHTS